MHSQNLGTRTLCLIYRWLEYKADHSPPFSAEGKNIWSFINTRLICLHDVVVRQTDKYFSPWYSLLGLPAISIQSRTQLFQRMEEENISEMLDFCSKLVWLVAWEDHHESFKSYIPFSLPSRSLCIQVTDHACTELVKEPLNMRESQ